MLTQDLKYVFPLHVCSGGLSQDVSSGHPHVLDTYLGWGGLWATSPPCQAARAGLIPNAHLLGLPLYAGPAPVCHSKLGCVLGGDVQANTEPPAVTPPLTLTAL